MPPCFETFDWKGFDATQKHSAAHSKLKNAQPLTFFSERLSGSASFEFSVDQNSSASQVC
jgi:hypothetical protein